MKSIKGTKTEKLLLTAFAGESQARNRYTFFASKAKKEGYEQIAAIFEETANNEKEHAKLFFKYLEGGEVEITGKFPAGMIGTTEENLLASANGEHEEWSFGYKEASKIAKEEGFIEISIMFQRIAAIEKEHEERYRKLYDNLKSGTAFKKEEKITWVCRNCGHVHEGTDALEICPVCKHPKAYFEEKSDNY